MKLIALHGFLGLPGDWVALNLGPQLEARDLWRDLAVVDESSAFESWTSRFVQHAQGLNEKPFLIGYSMGGRLALHAFLRAPDAFAGAMIISANPGLEDEKLREGRIRNDQAWAQRFLNEPWQECLRSWNEQGVFKGGSGEPERREQDYSRDLLAKALTGWSLGRQANLRNAISACSKPIHFVTGALDQKFTAINAELGQNGRHQHTIIEGAGHRLIWDQPQTLRNLIKESMS